MCRPKRVYREPFSLSAANHRGKVPSRPQVYGISEQIVSMERNAPADRDDQARVYQGGSPLTDERLQHASHRRHLEAASSGCFRIPVKAWNTRT